MIVTDCYYEDEIVRLSFGRFGLSKWQKIEKQHFVPELLGRRKISFSQAGAKTNESIEKLLFYTDENPTILDRVNRHKRCLDTRKSASHSVNSQRSASCQLGFLTMLRRLFEIPFSFSRWYACTVN